MEAINEDKFLALVAKSEDDLNIISALVQDGVLKKKNIRWFKKRNRFSMLINRFRWELISNEMEDNIPFGRVQSMLVFDGVLRVRSLGTEKALENQILSLLHIKFSTGRNLNEIKLVFSGNTIIMLKTEFIHVILQDLNYINKAKIGKVPNHKFGFNH